ncbi:MAG: cell division ATP-binding protein FtsE [Gemmatimonadota bacterium]|nr:MAG: cell division ATP-binding protein FtsE [Gemmatimonadota bacterium]
MVEFDRVFLKYTNWNILENVSFRIERGEFVFLTGPCGVGKSTILRLIYMADFPTQGRVRVDTFHSDSVGRKEIPLLRRKLGIVFQDFKLLTDRSVLQNVAFALRVTGTKKSEIKKRALHALTSVGLHHKRNAMPLELSGGEQQRVVIARAIVNEPFLLLADEPTGNLDGQAASDILDLLETINARGTAVLVATHNDHDIESHRHRTLRLVDGRLSELGAV